MHHARMLHMAVLRQLQVGQLGVPRGLRHAGRHGHLAGLRPRRRRRRRRRAAAAAGALPRLRVGDLRPVHGPGRGVVLPHVPRRRRVRPRPLGLPAPARRRLPRQRRLPRRPLLRPGRPPRRGQEHDLRLRALLRRRRVAPHRGRLPQPADHGGAPRRELGGEDGGVRRQLRLHLGLGVQDERLHQARGVSHRSPRSEGDGVRARRRGGAGRARHAGGGEHHRRVPRPLRDLPPRPRRRRHQQLLRQEHRHRRRARRRRRRGGRHAEAELLDGAAGGGGEGGGRAGGPRRRRPGRPGVRQPGEEDEDGERGRVPRRPRRRDGGVGAGRRRLPAEARRLLQEAGAGDAVQQVGEVGVGAVRRPEHRRRRPRCVERAGQGDPRRGHRAVVHGGAAPRAVPGGLPGDADAERRARAPAVQLLREEPAVDDDADRPWPASRQLLVRRRRLHFQMTIAACTCNGQRVQVGLTRAVASE
uniref:cDNA clone:J013014O02, full insert sequence n=1 Tax=Oryza sativa subsp. japonica TaxID=39947 RepID=B7EP28_ORYSJ|nr:unnamed protein product [Oryza sativa Japonica Group]